MKLGSAKVEQSPNGFALDDPSVDLCLLLNSNSSMNRLEPPGILDFLYEVLRDAAFQKLQDLYERLFFTELTAAEIVRRYAGNWRPPMLPGFLEDYLTRVPEVPLARMLTFLDPDSLMKLQCSCQLWAVIVVNERLRFRPRFLPLGSVRLLLNGSVEVTRRRSSIKVNHDQFSKSLQDVTFDKLLIYDEGTVEAVLYHIPELRCRHLELRIPGKAENEDELLTICEQMIVNSWIRKVTIIVRSDDCAALRFRLMSIVQRGHYIDLDASIISVLPP
ncbi:unnamed protein product [Caenorhabditis sp. 36 PRJEB53466]|nr:unnamed protein product [Caenorhabditis sp. 36 PRJEB53466]